MNSNSSSVRFDENVACDRCGRYGAYVFENDAFCADCYASRCSCCPEFGVDDLWTRDAAGRIPRGNSDLRCSGEK